MLGFVVVVVVVAAFASGALENSGWLSYDPSLVGAGFVFPASAWNVASGAPTMQTADHPDGTLPPQFGLRSMQSDVQCRYPWLPTIPSMPSPEAPGFWPD